jgi:mevalonate kinase
MSDRQFSAKVLLFGEYTILLDGHALAIPLDVFQSEWKQSTSCCELSLIEFCRFLKNSEELNKILDLDQFEAHIKNGLCFDSKIPFGYGLGSSGALTAAVLHQYDTTHMSRRIDDLKRILAQMESFFHGKSSGIDPLVSLENKYVLIDSPDHIRLIENTPISFDNYCFFLLDSHKPRKTDPLVNLFKSWIQNPTYRKDIELVLKPLNQKAISQFLKRQESALYKSFGAISRFQWAKMKSMICPGIEAVWEAGLASEDFYLKLCGAGGGGMYLGMAKKEKLALLPHEFPIILI